MKLVLAGLAASVVAVATTPAAAQLTAFTSRDTFNGSAGALTTETFNSVVTDLNFSAAPVTFGAMTLTTLGTFGNRVDAPPLEDTFAVNGTSYIYANTVGSTNGLTFTFSRAITAFGASFAYFQDDALRSVFTVNGQQLTPPQQTGRTVSFYGFTSVTPFTTVTLTGNTGFGDTFGIDDISYSAQAVGGVPEPATWALMVAGFGLLGGSLRRRSAVRFA